MGLQIGSGDQTRASHFVEEKKKGGVCVWGGCGRRKMGGVCVCVWVCAAVAVLGGGWWVFWGLNNSNDFPNLAQSRMWMAALERNCNGFIWLSVCFFIGRREGERESRKTEEEGGREGRRVSVSCQRSQMMEDVQNKLFHSDELRIVPVHLQTFAAEVANPEK